MKRLFSSVSLCLLTLKFGMCDGAIFCRGDQNIFFIPLRRKRSLFHSSNTTPRFYFLCDCLIFERHLANTLLAKYTLFPTTPFPNPHTLSIHLMPPFPHYPSTQTYAQYPHPTGSHHSVNRPFYLETPPMHFHLSFIPHPQFFLIYLFYIPHPYSIFHKNCSHALTKVYSVSFNAIN